MLVNAGSSSAALTAIDATSVLIVLMSSKKVTRYPTVAHEPGYDPAHGQASTIELTSALPRTLAGYAQRPQRAQWVREGWTWFNVRNRGARARSGSASRLFADEQGEEEGAHRDRVDEYSGVMQPLRALIGELRGVEQQCGGDAHTPEKS